MHGMNIRITRHIINIYKEDKTILSEEKKKMKMRKTIILFTHSYIFNEEKDGRIKGVGRGMKILAGISSL